MERDTGFEKTSQEMSKDDLFDDEEDDEQPGSSYHEDSKGEEGNK